MQQHLINTIAIDDEPLALQLVTGYILKTPFLYLAGRFDNPFSAVEFIQENPIDLIFLDIQMPDLLGTDFVRSLTPAPKIIFTSAHEKYALEGFRLEAVDYLLKPFEYEEFLVSAKKAQKLILMEEKSLSSVESNEQFLFLKSEYKIRRINFDDILYVEGLKDYVKVFLKGDPRPVMSINTLKTMEGKLPSNKFMRVHRSFIVNLERIDTIERSKIVFGKLYIPVSEQYREKFEEYIRIHFL